MSQEQQSCLRFSLEESIWFKRGQEVEELLSISLDPHITIQEQEQYVLIRGTLDLTGEYLPSSVEEFDREEDWMDNSINGKYVQIVEKREKGECEFVHRFPVDVTIPKNRIANLGEIDVYVEAFDYLIPENACLKLNADLTISGIYGEQQTNHAMELAEDAVLEPLHRPTPIREEGEETEREIKQEIEEKAEKEQEIEQEIGEKAEKEREIEQETEQETVEKAEEEQEIEQEIVEETEEEIESEQERDYLEVENQADKNDEEYGLEEEDKGESEEEYIPFSIEGRKQVDEELVNEREEEEEEEEAVPVQIHFDSYPTESKSDDNPRKENVFVMPEPELSESSEPASYEEEHKDKVTENIQPQQEHGYYEEESSSSSAEVEVEQESAEVEEEKKVKKSKKKNETISLTDFFARKEEERAAKLKVCIVQEGETLDYIAEKYELTVPQILRVNNLEANQDVYDGQVLYIPDEPIFKS
ncbi:LysM peptidoglycan-binding domain-containing protein [Bacillus seohaeanensis]|uniref:LysM peptidoglycan-binding domain-containing protein n=1 Tax=Bacillus seohaeanensis TaxID=284580 RepID=A0ABW5RT58_9BACI